MPQPRHIRLFAHLITTGNPMGGWRKPLAHEGGLHDIHYFLKMAQAAEAAKFDAVFFADGPGFRRVEGRDAFRRMDLGKPEPITLLSALAMGTRNIGLIATASTSFNAPCNIARKFAALDQLSGGRAGWNAVTSPGENEAHNLNFDTLADHATRYARIFYADMKRRAAAFGRDPGHLLIMPSIQTVIGATEAEAQERAACLDSLIHPDLALAWLQMSLGGVDLSGHPPDGPLPEIPPTKGGHSLRQGIIDQARRFGLSIRQIAQHVAATRRGQRLVGTPEQIADMLEHQFTTGAADGFVVSAPWLPGALTEFIGTVVPILRQRGLFRDDYEGRTLRENLGLPQPANRFVETPALHVEPEIWLPPPKGPARATH